jgi:hypothetical protein
MASEVCDHLVSARAGGSFTVSPHSGHAAVAAHAPRSTSGHSVAVWGTEGSSSVLDVLDALEAGAHADHALKQHSVVETDHVHPLAPSQGRVVLTRTDVPTRGDGSSDEDHVDIPTSAFDVVVVANNELVTSHSHDIARGLAHGGHSTLVVAGASSQRTEDDVISGIPDSLKLAISRAGARVVALAASARGVVATTDDVAHAALHATVNRGASGRAAPSEWASIRLDAATPNRGEAFTRRLSTQQTQPASEPRGGAGAKRASMSNARRRSSMGGNNRRQSKALFEAEENVTPGTQAAKTKKSHVVDQHRVSWG